MARTLTLSDGTTTVNFDNTNTTFGVDFDGWQQADTDPYQIRRESAYSEEVGLIHSVGRNVVETLTLDLAGTSHDAIATTIQGLMTLQKNARDYHTTRWQKTPVYLTSKALNETNTRYALVYDVRVKFGQSCFGVVFDATNYIEKVTITVEREAYWRSAIPRSALGTALTISAPEAPGTQADATEQYIANYRDTNALTHLYNFDDSAGTFSSNLIASASFSYFPATPAVSDIVYFGSTTGVWRHLVLNIGTAGSFVFSVTWEFWSGAAWVSTAGGIQTNTLVFTTSSPTGTTVIVLDTPTGWAPTTINAVSAYWIRARISAFTSFVSAPTQTGQVVYNPRDSFISVVSTQVQGDVEALAMLRYFARVNLNSDLDWIALGIKSRGLTTFISRFNCSTQNPGAWTVTNGTDTTSVADIVAPGGSKASCTFATNQTLIERARVSTTTNANIKDMEGEYHAYVRCQQVTGSAGDVSIKLRMTYSYTVDTPTVALKAVSGGAELVSLGRVSILPAQIITAADTASLDFRLSIFASALSATPDLYIYDIILIPIDEMAMVASTSGSVLTQSVADRNQGLDIDGGLYRVGPTQKGANGEAADAIISLWEQRGDPLRFPVDKAFNIYLLMAGLNTSVYYAREYFAGSVKAYTNERWSFLRGAE